MKVMLMLLIPWHLPCKWGWYSLNCTWAESDVAVILSTAPWKKVMRLFLTWHLGWKWGCCWFHCILGKQRNWYSLHGVTVRLLLIYVSAHGEKMKLLPILLGTWCENIIDVVDFMVPGKKVGLEFITWRLAWDWSRYYSLYGTKGKSKVVTYHMAAGVEVRLLLFMPWRPGRREVVLCHTAPGVEMGLLLFNQWRMDWK